MNDYIVFIKGINVGGKNILKMDTLKKDLKIQFGWDISTYIQSGNLKFQSSLSYKEVKINLLDFFSQSCLMNLSFILLKQKELEKELTSNPFKNVPGNLSHFVWMENVLEECDALKSYCNNEEEFQIGNKALYLYTPNGIGKSKVTTAVLERVFNQPVTIRNRNTVEKMNSKNWK